MGSRRRRLRERSAGFRSQEHLSTRTRHLRLRSPCVGSVRTRTCSMSLVLPRILAGSWDDMPLFGWKTCWCASRVFCLSVGRMAGVDLPTGACANFFLNECHMLFLLENGMLFEMRDSQPQDKCGGGWIRPADLASRREPWSLPLQRLCRSHAQFCRHRNRGPRSVSFLRPADNQMRVVVPVELPD